MLSSSEENAGKRNAPMHDLLVSTTTSKPPRHCPPTDFLRIDSESLTRKRKVEQCEGDEKDARDICFESAELKKSKFPDQNCPEYLENEDLVKTSVMLEQGDMEGDRDTVHLESKSFNLSSPEKVGVDYDTAFNDTVTGTSTTTAAITRMDTTPDSGTTNRVTHTNTTTETHSCTVTQISARNNGEVKVTNVSAVGDEACIDGTNKTTTKNIVDCTIPSICIPRINASVKEELVRSVIGEARFGKIESIEFHLVDKYVQTVLVHFSAWNEVDGEARECRRRLLAGEQVRVLCDTVKGWSWLISAATPLNTAASSPFHSSALPETTTSSAAITPHLSLPSPSQTSSQPPAVTNLPPASPVPFHFVSSKSSTSLQALPLTKMTNDQPVAIVSDIDANISSLPSTEVISCPPVIPIESSNEPLLQDFHRGEEVVVMIDRLPEAKDCSKQLLINMFQSFRGFKSLRYVKTRCKCFLVMKCANDAHALVNHLKSPGIRLAKSSAPLVGKITEDRVANSQAKAKRRKGLDKIIQSLKGIDNNSNPRELENLLLCLLCLEDEELESNKTIIYNLLYPYKFKTTKRIVLENIETMLDRLCPQSFSATVQIEGLDKSPSCSSKNIEEMFRSFKGFVTIRHVAGKGHCFVKMDTLENANVLLAHLESPGIRMNKQSPPLKGSLFDGCDGNEHAPPVVTPTIPVVSSESSSLSTETTSLASTTAVTAAPSNSFIESLINRVEAAGNDLDEVEIVLDIFLNLDFTDFKQQKKIIHDLIYPYKFASAGKTFLRKVKCLLGLLTREDNYASILIKGFEKHYPEIIIEEMFRPFKGFLSTRYLKKRGHCYVQMDTAENANVLLAHLLSPGIRMSQKAPPLTGTLRVRCDGKFTDPKVVKTDGLEECRENECGVARKSCVAAAAQGHAETSRLQLVRDPNFIANKEWMALALNDFLKFSTVFD